MQKIIFVFGVLISVFFSSFTVADILVSDARIKQVIPGRTTTAAYMNVQNTSATDVKLSAVRFNMGSSIEMHEIVTTDGLSGMRRRPAVVIAAGQTVAFKTGGLHLMVFGVQQALGEQVDIELCFDNNNCQTTGFKTEAW